MSNRKYPMTFEDIYRSIHEPYEALSIICFDDERGLWGAEVEAALATAEADLASAMEQIAYISKMREGKK